MFDVLRVLVDRAPDERRFLVLGNASPDIIKHVSESLAGRIEFVDLSGFNLGEINAHVLHNATIAQIHQRLAHRLIDDRSTLAAFAEGTDDSVFVWAIIPADHG